MSIENIGKETTDCIDLNDALKRLGGNMGLYKQLLGRFDGDAYLETIEQACQSNDREKAAHSAHALKGVSANLSLEKLKVAAVEFEGALESGDQCDDSITKLKESLKETKECIAAIIASS